MSSLEYSCLLIFEMKLLFLRVMFYDRNPDDGDKDDDDDDDDDNDDDDDDDNEIDNEIDDDDEPGKEFIDDEALVNNHCYFGRSMTPNEG